MVTRLVVGLSAVGVALVFLGGVLTRGDGTATESGGGKSAPDFSLPDVRDPATKVTLPSGKPVALYFFASWCVPCREEVPVVQKLTEERDDVAFVGVNHLDHIDDAKAFMEKYGATFPAAHDPGGDVALKYRLRSIPATVFIDADGRIDEVAYGGLNREDFDERLAALTLQGAPE